MTTADEEWITILSYENTTGSPHPMSAVRAWLRDRGIDWMPFDGKDVIVDLVCGRDSAGRPRGWVSIRVKAESLCPLGLHPDQPESRIIGPSPPRWWHADSERRLR